MVVRGRRSALSPDGGSPARRGQHTSLLVSAAILGILLSVILAVVLSSPLLRPPDREHVTIRFTTLDGRRVTTASAPYAGQMLVVDLMAAFCPPCEREMPQLLAFWEEAKNQGVTMISLSIWVGMAGFAETETDLAAFQRRWDADWTFGVPEDTVGLVLEYGVTSPPFKLILDGDGLLVATLPGETTASDLLEAVGQVP